MGVLSKSCLSNCSLKYILLFDLGISQSYSIAVALTARFNISRPITADKVEAMRILNLAPFNTSPSKAAFATTIDIVKPTPAKHAAPIN
jgi:hypothetical protein